MAVKLLEPTPTFKEFVHELQHRPSIRVVRVTDYGGVEPSNRQGAWVMQPFVKVVAAAFDKVAGEIVQYVEQKDADQMVTVIAGTGRAEHNDFDVVARKDELKALLQDAGYQVEDGEWTVRAAEAFLVARQKAYG
jgi:hypothetical protein